MIIMRRFPSQGGVVRRCRLPARRRAPVGYSTRINLKLALEKPREQGRVHRLIKACRRQRAIVDPRLHLHGQGRGWGG